MHISVNGPIHRYLAVMDITLEEFFERVKGGNIAATTILGQESLHAELTELSDLVKRRGVVSEKPLRRRHRRPN